MKISLMKPEPIPLLFGIAAAISAGLMLPLVGALLPTALSGRADFKGIFRAALLVRSGDAARMYDVPPFNHLPFEAVPFAILTPLGYTGAFIAFAALNCVLLFFATRALNLTGIRAAAGCAFAPIGLAFLQGQDSIITLLLLSCAAVNLGEGRDELAGGLAGLTFYKPQIGLPICALMFLWRRWRFALGFALSASACVAASIVTVGVHGFVGYVHLLGSMDPAKYGIVDSDMVGLRGLLSAALTGRALLGATAIATVAVLLYAFRKGRGASARYQFDLAIVACCLASYHMLPYDLVILLVPLASTWKRDRQQAATWVWAGLFVASAVLARTIENRLIAIPLLALCLVLGLGAKDASRRVGDATEQEMISA